jgi:hypothetical protein
MREKLLWITVTILGVMLASSHAQSPKQDTAPPQTSRYQLVAVPNSKEEVYRIDTATGKTWGICLPRQISVFSVVPSRVPGLIA